MHRRLVNEAGDASEDMEMGRHFHVPAKNCCLRCDYTFPFFVSLVVLRMISPKTGFLSFGKVLVSLLNSSVLRTLSPYRSCSKVLMQ